MKRVMALCLILLLLVGCSQTEPPVSEPEDLPQVTDPSPAITPEPDPGVETEPAPEPEVVPKPQPEVIPESVTEPEKEPVSEPEPEANPPVPPVSNPEAPPVQEPVPEETKPDTEDLAALAAGVYTEITENKAFNVWV